MKRAVIICIPVLLFFLLFNSCSPRSMLNFPENIVLLKKVDVYAPPSKEIVADKVDILVDTTKYTVKFFGKEVCYDKSLNDSVHSLQAAQKLGKSQLYIYLSKDKKRIFQMGTCAPGVSPPKF